MMDDNTRENLVGWGQAVANYAMLNSDKYDASDMILIDAAIEHEHTRYVVTERTGDARLGDRAARRAGAGVYLGWYAVMAITVATFAIGIALSMAAGDGAGGTAVFWLVCIPGTIAALVGSVIMMARFTGDGWHSRQTGNLPSEKDLNKSGYWEVEPDVWHNPINGRTLTGHAYRRQEYSSGRSSYRSESQQINALYRQMKHNRPSLPSAGPDPRRAPDGNAGRGLFDRTDGT